MNAALSLLLFVHAASWAFDAAGPVGLVGVLVVLFFGWCLSPASYRVVPRRDPVDTIHGMAARGRTKRERCPVCEAPILVVEPNR